ncbi:acyl-CoA dehydrogenase [Streptomyces viridiviolaceus]|uniref:Acyl-CoA dehydrogenase family protein n=1 Tax=Streptomyces viridiviolaceus TaxID=68282 RepID=A0ABW2E561_9ACTN|nr:acyl-CoA dehydrogenase family protein [Streptomyces viridiviolaceus]GHB56698.1 acyl-CoA dehydrogenase [Streptomyces viridiviolaceus]
MSQLATELSDLVDDLVRGHAATDAADERRALWEQARELGLHRVGIAEERGGSGGAFEDLLTIVGALGRNGVSLPVIETSTADWVIAHGAGLTDRVATLFLADHPLDTTAGTLTSKLRGVPWARDSEVLVVCAPGTAPLLVDLGHPSVEVRPGENLAGEPRDVVVLDDVPVTARADGGPDAEQVRTRLALLWSGAVAGAAHGAFRLTKTYVAERRQFGGPLLKIPAVAGNLALMRVELLQADAALSLALDGRPSPFAVESARLVTATAATTVARIAHQLHGAMGITQEYPLHRFTRRLWAWRDAVTSERECAESLGHRAAALGEEETWDLLTPA